MSESNSAWLTVSQAAAALGVSERTIRRRCESGKIASHLATTENGREWQIEAAAVISAGTSEAAAIGAASAATLEPTSDNFGQIVEEVRPEDQSTLADVSEAAATPQEATASIGQSADAVTAEFLREALTHEREQNAFLRAQIEAHARSEAELRAALREALKGANRALPEGTTDATHESEAPDQSTLEAQPDQAELLQQIETLQANQESQRKEIEWMAKQMQTPPSPQKRGLWARWFGSD